jgi:hypothetical protein
MKIDESQTREETNIVNNNTKITPAKSRLIFNYFSPNSNAPDSPAANQFKIHATRRRPLH